MSSAPCFTVWVRSATKCRFQNVAIASRKVSARLEVEAIASSEKHGFGFKISQLLQRSRKVSA